MENRYWNLVLSSKPEHHATPIKLVKKGKPDRAVFLFFVNKKAQGSLLRAIAFMFTMIACICAEAQNMTDTIFNLKETVVVGKSKEQRKRELPNSVTVLDMKKLEGRSLSIDDILNQAVGVKVLQKGGLGNNSRMIVQGLDGKGIGIFVNGMPMGSSDEFQIGTIPPDMIENIEIYKGVVPANLGGDGLSGAINIIIKNFNHDHLEASYEIGSMNTHRVNAMSKKFFDKSGVNITGGVSYDYSDNDYKFNSPYVSVPEYVKADNNAYKHLNANAAITFTRQWFDVMSFGFGYDYRYKEVQGGMVVIQSKIGHTHVKDKSYTATQLFSKAWMDHRLKFDLNSMIEYNIENLVDTSSVRYNWDGTTEHRVIPGEWGSFPNNSDDKCFNVRELLNVKYFINGNHFINWNASYKFNKKDPEDELNDQYSTYSATMYASRLHALVSGLTYGISLFDGRLKNELSGKYYYHYSEVLPSNDRAGVVSELKTSTNHSSTLGWSEAIAWKPIDDFTVKASVSKAVRIPVSYEIFGDGIMITPAPNVTPEKSFNMNIGASWAINQRSYPNLNMDINAFYMNVDDMIRLFSTEAMKMSYINLDKAVIKGIEGEVKSELTPWASAKINFTYQDSRDNNKEAVGGGDNWHYDYRIPNMPYCFGNAALALHCNDLLCRNSYSSLFVDSEYTHEFSYSWEANSSNTLIIPEKWNFNIGIRQSFASRYHISLEVHNLFDKEQWSEFRYPQSGRTLHAKFRYTL